MRRNEFEVQVPDGRRLIAEVAGPDEGELVVSHTGTPGSRHTYEQHLCEGADRGLRHVTYSRPGYEGSDRLPGRAFADCVADTVAVVDALGVDSFHVVGNSGGAPHALACAALLPTRVRSVATISGFAPRDAEGLDWLAGMGAPNVAEFTAVAAGDSELQRSIEGLAASMLGDDGGGEIGAALEDCLCPADLECLVEPFLGFNLEGFKRSIGQGIWGWFDDDKAAYGDWGFDPARIEVPLTLWHGADDRFVPAAHTEWLAARLPAASCHLLAGEGHVSMYVRNYGAVLDELIGRGG
jgi:pimeloyl-ACP methyl ester carboxylesterase